MTKKHLYKKIPKPTIKRLSIYYRILLEIRDRDYIRSKEISKLTGFTSSQIRHDLTYFGQFGIPGKGYHIKELKSEIIKILGVKTKSNVVLIGVGNLGSALLSYQGFKKQGFEIVSAFDIDHRKINRIRNNLKILHINDLKNISKKKNIKIAIMTVPAPVAQEVVNIIVCAGIKAILNFAPTKLKVPEKVNLLNIDMAIELSRLSYLVAP